MEIAIKNFPKNNLNIISDSDVVIVKRNWDKIIKNLILGDNHYGLIGVPYEGLNGFSTGTDNFQTYKNKPTTTWLAFSPYYKFSQLKLLPEKENFLKIDSIDLSNLYELPIGYNLLKDVGWQIPLFIKEKKYSLFYFGNYKTNK